MTSPSYDSSRTGVEGAGPLANERRRRNFSRFALRHARSHLGPGPALPKLALDHSSPPQNGRPWTTLGDIGPTLDRVVQGWTKPKWQHCARGPAPSTPVLEESLDFEVGRGKKEGFLNLVSSGPMWSNVGPMWPLPRHPKWSNVPQNLK